MDGSYVYKGGKIMKVSFVRLHFCEDSRGAANHHSLRSDEDGRNRPWSRLPSRHFPQAWRKVSSALGRVFPRNPRNGFNLLELDRWRHLKYFVAVVNRSTMALEVSLWAHYLTSCLDSSSWGLHEGAFVEVESRSGCCRSLERRNHRNSLPCPSS